MATSKQPSIGQAFDQDQLHSIALGKTKHDVLKNTINEALFNNPFNSNFILSSPPGLAKSYETEQALDKLRSQGTHAEPVVIEGTGTLPAFTIDMATAVFLSGGKPLTVILDDCDLLFEDKNLNTTKKMFDDTKALKYNKNFRALKGFCTDLQFEAIESFSSDDKAGFSIPLNNVTFLILTNRYFPTINEVEEQEGGTRKEAKYTDLHAIRRRTEGETIAMDNATLWGYVANIVINAKICEKFKPAITNQEKIQILEWLHARWDRVTERNLSLVEKMTKDMVRYPTSYKDIWKRYVEVK
jgi:hypothetical protein